MSPLSIKLAKPGSSVPKADRSRMASIGSMSILSDLPRTDFTLTFGAFAGLCLPPLPELRAFGNSVSCPAIHFPLSMKNCRCRGDSIQIKFQPCRCNAKLRPGNGDQNMGAGDANTARNRAELISNALPITARPLGVNRAINQFPAIVGVRVGF